MRFATVHVPGGSRPVVVDGDQYLSFPDSDHSIPGNMRDALENWTHVRFMAEQLLRDPNAKRTPLADATILPPVPNPRKIICLGLNYADHAKEGGVPIPKDPVLFSKYATALIGHGQDIVLPPVSQEVDYEAELVVVVGERGRNVPAEKGMDYVAGYTIGHDVSARDWQMRKDGKQWMVGKTFDTFAPTGPVFVTKDEVPDPHNLGIRLRLNGETMQDSNTRQMIFPIGQVIAYLSLVFTIEPGDLIFTGTPPGVGFARKPPVFLRGGDVVEVEIDGLGVLRNPVIQG
jgi:2-keto-4-pentenoate hydratase/2-oxohepta-3-ene-1,7-dioic acid hydratase in catechol pathway